MNYINWICKGCFYIGLKQREKEAKLEVRIFALKSKCLHNFCNTLPLSKCLVRALYIIKFVAAMLPVELRSTLQVRYSIIIYIL